MKRSISILAAAFMAMSAFGQNMYDALRFSKLDYEGTARSMALGNAFTALGGDIGAITINPAASGVYLYNEVTITPSLTNTVEKTAFMANPSANSYRTRFGMSNIGSVFSMETGRKSGLVAFNWGIIANQTANYTSRTQFSGEQTTTSKLASMAYLMSEYGVDSDGLTHTEDYNPYYNTNALWEEVLAWNTSLVENIYDKYTYIGATENIGVDDQGNDYIYLGGPLRQGYFQETTGYNEHITLNFGGNVSHKLYFGVNLTLQTIWYNKIQTLSEEAEDKSDFDTEFERFRHTYNQTITGTGFNAKAGIIYRPVAGLRLGATISTPTWSRYVDESSERMEARVYNADYNEHTPLNSYSYKMTSPFRWSLGAAYTFGKRALVSVDYESTNYGSARFVTDQSMYLEDIEYFNNENAAIKSTFRRVNNLRAGVEFKPVDQLALRAGYNFLDNTEKGFNDQIHYASLGIGYTTKSNVFIDLAYRQQCNYISEGYDLYDTSYTDVSYAPHVETKYLNWKLLLTLGWRF